MEAFDAYIPLDRRQAMASGHQLPDRTRGSALFADISGFTPLTEALVRELGPRRGADELTRQLNRVYNALIAEVHRYRGSVIAFSGDAITCWLDGDDGSRAIACALAMQSAMAPFAHLETPSGLPLSLFVKASVASGPVRRFLVGDPQIQVMDVLAGVTLDRMADAGHHAERGEVVVSPEIVSQLGDQIDVIERQSGFAVVNGLASLVEATPWPALTTRLAETQTRSWLIPPVYARLKAGLGRYLDELRLGIVLFQKFGGIDYDHDQAAGQKLDTYLRWVQRVLAHYEGYMFQVTLGDKGCYLYGAFGAPLAHDDDPERAIAAAIELRSPPAEIGPPGGIQIGISWGRVRAGDYGSVTRRTYGVLGDEVNVAARLMDRAEPGQILVSGRMAEAVAASCRLRSIGQITLKGKEAPMAVSLVLGRRQGALPRLSTAYAHPLVGHDIELARMERLLETVLRGNGQVLRLEGEVGLGKSHLAAEYARRALVRGLKVVVGICQSTGQAVPYYPWRQILSALLGLDQEPEGIDPLTWIAGQIARIEATVSQTNPSWFSRLPLLGDLLGLPIPDTPTTAAFDPQVRQQALFALVTDVVQAYAAQQPLLVLLEDLRWMDEASQELALAIGQGIARAPVLLVLVHRPPIDADQPLLPGLSRLPYHHHLNLGELSAQGVSALIADRLRGQPSELVVSLIQAQAQGNPLFTEELVDTLREAGALCPDGTDTWVLSGDCVRALRQAGCLTQREDGQWALVRNAPLAAAELGIPDTIHGVVLTRIDRLPEDHKLSLKVASVIGRSFEFDLLAQSHPVHPPHDALLKQVNDMDARGFTRVKVPLPRLIYMFRHSITQEVVHGTLVEDQERELHRLVGETLEHLLPEAVERLAYHYFEGQVWPEALNYNLQVARQAQRGFANDIALQSYQRALKASAGIDADTAAEQLLIHESLGEVLTLTGQYVEALAHYACARALVPPGDVCHAVELHRKTAEVYERRSEYAVALEWLERGLHLVHERAASIEAARIYLLQAGIYQRQGKYDQAIDRCQRSLTTATQIDTREGRAVVAHAYYLLGGVHIRRGNLSRAVQYCRQSIAGYQQIDDIVGQAKAHNNLGIALKSLGEWQQARDAFHKSLDIDREIGDVQERGLVTNNLGNIALDCGEWAEAAALYQESNAIWVQLGAALPEAVTLSNLAQVHIYQGDWQAARDCLNRSRDIFERIGSDHFMPELERRWGELALRTGALEEAVAHAQRSIELAMNQETRVEEGMSLRLLGETYLARGDAFAAPAESVLRHSLNILQALNSGYEAAKTALTLTRSISHAKREEAVIHLAYATQAFEALGAQADLERAIALAAEMGL